MHRIVAVVTAVLGLAGLALPAAAQDRAEGETPPVEVMILGTYHFANPGRDVVNIEVDDVLAPRRQREIEQLVRVLAGWEATKIAVESQAEPPGLVLESYAEAEALLRTSRNESIQIGYRMGRMLGHEAVYGYDEQPGEGEPDYFPLPEVRAFAEANGQADVLERVIAKVRSDTASEQDDLSSVSIAESLLHHNDAERIDARHDVLYYTLLSIGDGDAQPGAELNAYWYMRNAKMFAKIDMIAEPGDRVFVLAGSGHATWLRHFVRRMPGYALVDSMPYLRAAIALGDADASDAVE